MRHFSKLVFVNLFLLTLVAIAGANAGEVFSKINDGFEQTEKFWETRNDSNPGTVDGANSAIRRALNIPSYFAMPHESFVQIDDATLNKKSTLPNAPVLLNFYQMSGDSYADTSEENRMGMRLIVAKGDVSKRLETSKALAASGLFQTGDIILTLRPEWHGTLRYSHIQLGVSHAGVLYHENGLLKNLDMPLDDKHVANGIFDSEHYTHGYIFHVLRPRGLTEKQKSNLNGWLSRLAKNGKSAYKSKIFFNTNYSDPRYNGSAAEPMKFVGDIGRIALGERTQTSDLKLYCSEFAWAITSLKDCDPVLDAAAFKSQGQPRCIKEAFKPMPVFGTITTSQDVSDAKETVGMADGILLTMLRQLKYLNNEKKEASGRKTLINRVFSTATGKGQSISSGHLQVEKQLGDAFFNATQAYFRAVVDPKELDMDPKRDQPAMPTIVGVRAKVNPMQNPNYSPTAFAVHAHLPQAASIKAMDYVGTLVFSKKVKVNGRDTDLYDYLKNLNVNAQ